MKYLVLFITLFLSINIFAEETGTADGQNLEIPEVSLKDKLKSLPNLSEKIIDFQKLNSFPGVDEAIIIRFIQDSKRKEPFLVKKYFRNIVGSTKLNAPIPGATIYIVNPNFKEGPLWWKHPKVITINEPHWTHFLKENKSLDQKLEVQLKEILIKKGPN